MTARDLTRLAGRELAHSASESILAVVGSALAAPEAALSVAATALQASPSVGQVQVWLIAALIVVGCGFLTVGTIGLLRFDTVYNRMHATSKPTTLGVASIFVASALYFGPGGAALPSLLAVVFLFLTIPTGTHMMARSAQRMGVPFRESVTWPEPPRSDDGEDERARDERPDGGAES